MKMYIDFGVARYALADVCEALFKCGVKFLNTARHEQH